MLTEADLQPETKAALAALRGVQPFIEQRRGASDVHAKGFQDIVTGTDLLVQKEIQRILHLHHPDIAFRGEEDIANTSGEAIRTWLVDPICGTTNFAARLPLVATNIALVEPARTVAAAVADGGTGELYVAERGRGAWLVDGTALRPLQVSYLYGVISVDPDNRGGRGLADFPTAFAIEALEQRHWDVRALSSTIALAYLASGRLAGAVYAPMGSPLHFAAGVLLASEAGAIASDHTGGEWTVDSPILVVAATRDLHSELQSLAARVYARLSAND